MKLYKNLVEASIGALQRIFLKGEKADRVVEQVLRSNRKWGSRDRRFIAETIYNAVRWYRLWYEILGKKPVELQEWWVFLAIGWWMQKVELPDWVEWKGWSKERVEERYALFEKIDKIRESIPDWLDDLGREQLGERWPSILTSLNNEADVILRTNTLKTSRDQLQQVLRKESVYTRRIGADWALRLVERRALQHLKPYHKGWFEVQDYSSQQVAPFLDVWPDMQVIDACAGAGGKALHLAAMMQNKGELVVMDVEQRKLKELNKRMHRAGVSIAQKHWIDPDRKAIGMFKKWADRLLLDVPCSGLGVLRRQPDSKWRLTPKFIQKIQQKQQEILQTYTEMCRVDGLVVYATCSILPSENHLQVQKFLESEQGQKFELVQQKTYTPESWAGDGFYMALLRRIS